MKLQNIRNSILVIFGALAIPVLFQANFDSSGETEFSSLMQDESASYGETSIKAVQHITADSKVVFKKEKVLLSVARRNTNLPMATE